MIVRELLPLFRVPNLFIILLSQALPYGYLLRTPTLDVAAFACLALATLLTALAGYVINDLFDIGIDRVNKPDRVTVGRFIPSKRAYRLYFGLLIAIGALAAYLDVRLAPAPYHWPLLIFPGISLLLYLYSWKLKCTPLLGNLLVAFFCGLTPLLILIPEYEKLRQSGAVPTIHSFQSLALFAFLSNFFREQIKDLEDREGDQAHGCRTLAVRAGLRAAGNTAGATGLALTALLAVLVFAENTPTHWIAGGFFLLLPALWATWLTFRASNKHHFRQAGLLVKLLMVFGIGGLVLGL